MSKACVTNPALWQFHGRSSRFHDSPLSSHQLKSHQSATRSHADWQQELPPIQQSPQQRAMTEARRILQQKRQTDPSYAALPACFGLDDQTRAHLRSPGWNNAETEQVAVMCGASTSAVQVCLLCFTSQLFWSQVMSSDACIQLKPAACIGICDEGLHALCSA